jgi:hypothetical protein
LPGLRATAVEPQPEHTAKPGTEPKVGGSIPSPKAVAASLALAAASGDRDAEPHYKTAVVALKDDNMAIAAEEMSEAAKLAPENPLVLYGLAVVQSRNDQPELALPNIEKATSLGLPPKESAEAEDLTAAIRYAIKKNAAEQKRITPTKLWGSYDFTLEDPAQEFIDRAGHAVYKTTTPLTREMSLWKIEDDSNIRGHWLEKNTITEEIIYADSKRRDPKPKSTIEEHWWLLTILINQDGSLDGSRMETCVRQTGLACTHSGTERGRVITFKGRVEPNGDLAIDEEGAKSTLTIRKKSRVSSTPPQDVHIRLE